MGVKEGEGVLEHLVGLMQVQLVASAADSALGPVLQRYEWQ